MKELLAQLTGTQEPLDTFTHIETSAVNETTELGMVKWKGGKLQYKWPIFHYSMSQKVGKPCNI
jgi:hypothetical protein